MGILGRDRTIKKPIKNMRTPLEIKYHRSITLNFVLVALLIFCIFWLIVLGPLPSIFKSKYERDMWFGGGGSSGIQRCGSGYFATVLYKDNSYEDLWNASWTYHATEYYSGWMGKNDLSRFINVNDTITSDQRGWFKYWLDHFEEDNWP